METIERLGTSEDIVTDQPAPIVALMRELRDLLVAAREERRAALGR